jgi:hypothetical protein
MRGGPLLTGQAHLADATIAHLVKLAALNDWFRNRPSPMCPLASSRNAGNAP